MSTLVDDLLVYARHGTRTMREEEFDLVGLVDDLSEEFAAPAEAAGLQLGKQLPAEALPVCGDSPAVRRAVANLLANAVRLAPKGTTVTVSADRFDDWNFISSPTRARGLRWRTIACLSTVLARDRDQARRRAARGLASPSSVRLWSPTVAGSTSPLTSTGSTSCCGSSQQYRGGVASGW